MQSKKRIILGVSGASGMPLTYHLLKILQHIEHIETHLIVSDGARRVLEEECQCTLESLQTLASKSYAINDISAGPASGSWQNEGMIICPCSMSSLAAIACGVGSNLLHRSADVTLKERRPLIIVARETPLNLIHVENMARLIQAGATIMPFVPAFYTKPQSLEDLLNHFCGRLLDQLGIDNTLLCRWRNNS